MKTINDIQKEMDEIQVSLCTGNLEEKDIKKARKRHGFLSVCKQYLQTHPAEEYLVTQRDRLNSRLNKIAEGYIPDPSLLSAGLKKQERLEYADYHKIMETKKVREQYLAILFLLS